MKERLFSVLAASWLVAIGIIMVLVTVALAWAIADEFLFRPGRRAWLRWLTRRRTKAAVDRFLDEIKNP